MKTWTLSSPFKRQLEVRGYLPLAPRRVLHLANQSYWLGLNEYLRNDQQQVGVPEAFASMKISFLLIS